MLAERYVAIRKKTGLSAYAFSRMLEQRGMGTVNHYYKIERGDVTPKQEQESAIIALNAELRRLPFNDVLIELRGQEAAIA